MVGFTISLAAMIAVLVSLAKPYIELALKPTNPVHDATIQMLAVVIGIVGNILNTAIVTQTLSLQTAWSAAGDGVLAAAGAISLYHLVPRSVFAAVSQASARLLPGVSSVPPEPPAPTP